ncbi:MAG TPA: hypothetical protein VGF75_01280, partial [Candidatus Saccharimonadales bacterium]
MMNKATDRILTTIKGKAFYRFVIGFFVFEAAWIALTAAYPQAFDEQFHFGLIKLYSHYTLPFLSKQPAGANAFGAVARDPSYLYHYLMSFPYRIIELVTKRQAYQVIALRLIDIALFAYGLILFRKILLKTKLSEGLANVTILIFALIPIAPQLAGQINYDDMLFPLVAATCLLCFKLIDQIRSQKVSFRTLSSILILATLASLVKFAFLPIFLGLVCFFAVYILHSYRKKLAGLWRGFKGSFRKESLLLKLLMIGGMIVAGGLFIQRDAVNLVEYHSVDPACSSVISLSDCKAYSAWYASYKRHEENVVTKKVIPDKNVFTYAAQWTYWMWYRLFFAVNGQTSGYVNYPPLPLPSAIALVIGIVGVVAVIRYRRELFHANAYATFLMVACLFYIVALIAQGYATYQFTAVLENMNGRYFLPVLLLLGAIFAKAFSIALKRSEHLKVIIACVVVLLFLEGGGLVTYIARSDNTWYWQNSKAI